jgi:hypothetical protein
VAPGCDSGGASGLEEQPEVKKDVTPSADMPGLKQMEDKMKKEKKGKM